MKKIIPFLILLCVPVLLFSSTGKSKPRVGVTTFANEGVQKHESLTITDLFRSKLVESGAFDVLNRKNMDKMLKEIEFQKLGLTGSDRAVKIGKMLNLEYIIYGTLSKLDRSYIISVEMVNIETSKIETSVSRKFYGLDNADIVIAGLVNAVVMRKSGTYETPKEPETPEEIKKYLEKKLFASASKYKIFENLGYLTSYDEILEKYYAFLLYKETSMPSGDSVIKVGSNIVIGNVFRMKNLQNTAKEAYELNKPYSTFGYKFKPSKGDNRQIEYRIYQKKGKPAALEIFVVTRDKDWKVKKPVTLKYELE